LNLHISSELDFTGRITHASLPPLSSSLAILSTRRSERNASDRVKSPIAMKRDRNTNARNLSLGSTSLQAAALIGYFQLIPAYPVVSADHHRREPRGAFDSGNRDGIRMPNERLRRFDTGVSYG